MSDSSSESQNRYFQFDWSAFNTVAGLKYTVAILITVLLTAFTDFSFINIMITAFLAWLTEVPGTTKYRVGGMAVFAVIGAAMIWLATAVRPRLLSHSGGRVSSGSLRRYEVVCRGIRLGSQRCIFRPWPQYAAIVDSRYRTGGCGGHRDHSRRYKQPAPTWSATRLFDGN
jgi:hypothetical protein